MLTPVSFKSVRLMGPAFYLLALTAASPLSVSASVVSDWNKVALAEVRLAKQGPPVVARSLAIAHTCI